MQQIDPEKAQRLYEGLPWHDLLRDYMVDVRDQVGLDIIGFDLGIWSDQMPFKAPKFMVMEGPFDSEKIATKLLGLEYQQDEHKGIAYYRLHEDYKVTLRHPLRVLASPLNRVAFVGDRFLAAPATPIIQQLIDVQKGEAPTLLDSKPHRTLAGAIGDGLLGGTFFTPGWIVDNWRQLRDKPFAQLDKYETGPDPWGVLSPYSHALLGYRIEGERQENVVALYYPDPALAERDAAELEKRWNSYRVEIPGAGEALSPAQKCSPFSTAVVQGAGSSVLVGTCPGDPGLWTRLFFIGQPLLFLVPDLDELREGASTEVQDRYGNSIPLKDALAVMSKAAKQVLQDTGVDTDECVAIYTDWKWTYRYEPMDEALLEGLISRLKEELPMEIRRADRESTESPCVEGKGPRYILFEPLVLSSEKLYAAVSEGCGIDCWGNSGATYIFSKEGGHWQLEKTTGVWAD